MGEADWAAVGPDGRRAHIYAMRDGFIFAGPRAYAGETRRHPCVVLISLSGAPFVLKAGSVELETRAALVSPQVGRAFSLAAEGVASINIEPSHPAWRGLAGVTTSAVCLSQAAYAASLDALIRCAEGLADFDEAVAVFDDVLHITSDMLDVAATPVRGRTDMLLDMIMETPPAECAFDDLRRVAAVSAGRLSHLFRDEVGLSIRSFMAWRRTKAALQLLGRRPSATEVAHELGFSDSAHLTHTLRGSIGILPSRIGPSRYVQVHGPAPG